MSKLTTKGKKGQPTEQELEAARLEEERKRIEEEKRLEEARRKEVRELPTGLLLLLTEWAVEEGWKQPNPKNFFFDNIKSVFESRGILENFEDVDIWVLADFHTRNLVFAKKDLELDDKRATILMNIFWRMITFKNPLYEKKIEGYKDMDIKERCDLFIGKTLDTDFEELKRVILMHSNDQPPAIKAFEIGEVKSILDYCKASYFNHYTLFKYTLFSKQPKEEKKIEKRIEFPEPCPPLSEGQYTEVRSAAQQEEEKAEVNKQMTSL